jgi:protein gp37
MPTGIEWTDETWNVVTGCKRVSPGCDNCYAARLAAGRLRGHPRYEGVAEMAEAGPRWTGEVRWHRELLEQPLRWQRPRRIFVCAQSDLFHPYVPPCFIADVWAVMASAKQHTFQVLTKRPARMQYLLTDPPGGVTWPLPNVWLGVSVEDQQRAEERIPLLLQTPAALRYVSCEPLLGAVNLKLYLPLTTRGRGGPIRAEGGIGWVIGGGESGPGARPMHPDWARSLRDQCQAADVPFFFKQWGAWAPYRTGIHGASDVDVAGQVMTRIGKRRAGRLLDGREWEEMPEVPRAG